MTYLVSTYINTFAVFTVLTVKYKIICSQAIKLYAFYQIICFMRQMKRWKNFLNFIMTNSINKSKRVILFILSFIKPDVSQLCFLIVWIAKSYFSSLTANKHAYIWHFNNALSEALQTMPANLFIIRLHMYGQYSFLAYYPHMII